MQSRRNLMIAASALSTMGGTVGAVADEAKVVDYLLVQTAKGLAFDKGTNMLNMLPRNLCCPGTRWPRGADA